MQDENDPRCRMQDPRWKKKAKEPGFRCFTWFLYPKSFPGRMDRKLELAPTSKNRKLELAPTKENLVVGSGGAQYRNSVHFGQLAGDSDCLRWELQELPHFGMEVNKYLG